jgi:multidrug efflux pump subunit AcrA (membrane-fusion protein)
MSLSIAKLKKYALPAAILIGGIVISQLIISNPPQANRQKASRAPQMTVEVQTLTPQLYQVKLSSFGTIRPRTESVLVAQASGQINYISNSFRDGGFF